MKFLLWRLRLAFWCWRYQYAASWWRPISTLQFAMQDDCWRDYFEDGLMPKRALFEDASYA